MKFFKKRNSYENSSKTLKLHMNDLYGTSYDWYSIVKTVNGVTYLNTYPYSITTSKHIRQIRSLLYKLNIPFVEIQAPRGLDEIDSIKEFYKTKIMSLVYKVLSTRTRYTTKERIKGEINKLMVEQNEIKNLERV